MRPLPLILFSASVILPLLSFTNSSVLFPGKKPIKQYHKTFFGKQYVVTYYTEDDWREFMTITPEGKDSVIFEQDLRIKDAGDCNGRASSITEYEFKKDSLFVYTYTHVTELWDISKPVHKYYSLKEIYVVRKTGEFIRVKSLHGKYYPEVTQEVEARLKGKL